MQAHRCRPRVARQPGERATLALRLPGEVFNQLSQAAESKGRALSNEAEIRLEGSFQCQRMLDQILELTYGRQLATILLLLGNAMEEAARQAVYQRPPYTLKDFDNWMADPAAFRQATEAAQAVLSGLKPAGDAGVPETVPAGLREDWSKLGETYARQLLHALADDKFAPPPLEPFALRILERLHKEELATIVNNLATKEPVK
jgi:hypothetical protein